MSVYIIAEAGVNHNGNLDIAKKLVDVAKEAGADAIKFQTFKAEESTGVYADKAEYQKRNDPTMESQIDMIKKLELPFYNFALIQSYCKENQIDFISTPDGTESLNYLLSLNVPLIKVGSTEVTNLEFLKAIARSGKQVILSTGMSTLGEVETALETMWAEGNRDISIMHCTTDYPTQIDEVNLKAMITMKQAFHVTVGYSDHTLGYEAAIAATAMGASFIEKHITLDRTLPGPDHMASMPPNEFKEYVNHIRNTETLLGDGIKKPTSHELEIMQQARRSILAKSDLKKGTVLKKDMFCYKRPGTGIRPDLAEVLVGRTLKRDLKREEIINWEDV